MNVHDANVAVLRKMARTDRQREAVEWAVVELRDARDVRGRVMRALGVLLSKANLALDGFSPKTAADRWRLTGPKGGA